MVRVASLLLMIAVARPAAAEIARVWAVDDGTKVYDQDFDHPLRDRNLTFDGKTVKLVAARNEIVSFQVVVEGGETATAGVSLGVDGDIPGSLDIFAEHYVAITERSRGLYWERTARPAIGKGAAPDALIPQTAAGIEVPAARIRAFWVDVYIPKAARAELVRATVNVTPCVADCRFELELDVIDATLPDVPTAKTMLWFSGDDSDLAHFQLARRNRITLFLGNHDAPTDALEERLTGRAFSADAGYRGPGAGQPQDIYVLHTYGGRVLPPAEAASWSRWLRDVAPGVDAFYYVWDEPDRGEFDEINRRIELAKPIPSFVTHPVTPELSADIFAALPSHWTPGDENRRSFVYNGVLPFSGTFVIDDAAISPRVNPWIQYKYGVERWFYWEATYYDDFQGGRGAIDVLSRADNFTNRYGDLGNGDGLLIYPGPDGRPLPSIRLHNWRRGIQDVEYLQLARDAGLDAFVDELLDVMITRALNDTSQRRRIGWSDSGEDWLLARRLLATALATGKPPPIPDSLRRSTRGHIGWLAWPLLLALGIMVGVALRTSRKRL